MPSGYRGMPSLFRWSGTPGGTCTVHTPCGEPFLVGTAKPLPPRDGVMGASLGYPKVYRTKHWLHPITPV